MLINAYKSVLIEKERTEINDDNEIVKHLSKSLLEEELETIGKKNKEKLIKKIETILINNYEIVEEEKIEYYIKSVLIKEYLLKFIILVKFILMLLIPLLLILI